MVQLIYKYDKCSECGQEQFQWGVVIEFRTLRLNELNKLENVIDHIFICHMCVKEIDIKLDDLKENSKHLLKVNENELKHTRKTILKSINNPISRNQIFYSKSHKPEDD